MPPWSGTRYERTVVPVIIATLGTVLNLLSVRPRVQASSVGSVPFIGPTGPSSPEKRSK